VTIKQIENSIIDEGFANGWVSPQPPERLTGKTVAVVGSGPAGLAAAQQLTRAGHTVVVFERDEQPGGLLRFGIPSFKLEKHLVERRIAQMKDEGTRFRTGVELGRDMSWAELRRRYDAVVVATGATVPRNLDVSGYEHAGVHVAMDYLTAQNRAEDRAAGLIDARVDGLAEDRVAELASGPAAEVTDGQSKGRAASLSTIDAAGKHVVVIGGGDTGADCVGTAHRQGAASVTSLAIGAKPPVRRTGSQPWPTHPTLFEVSSSHEEGGQRNYLASTVEIVADESGTVRGVLVAETGISERGREPIAGTEHLIRADLVLIAMGFTGAEEIEPDGGFVLPQGGKHTFVRDERYATNLPGVFVAGDAGRGQSLIVWAIAEGRSAAAAVDEYLLSKVSVLPTPVRASDHAFSL
jgi:glutamate synthase (NADPH/NADH) small chain